MCFFSSNMTHSEEIFAHDSVAELRESRPLLSHTRMASYFYKWIIFFQVTAQCSSQFLCPPAEIGSSVELICNHSNSSSIFVNTPSGTIAAACTPTCSGPSRYNGSNINETQTRLTILKVEHRDGGTWTCQYGTEEENVKCNLNLYKIPSCKISSDQDTSSLTLGQEITLYLNVNNSYCDEDNKLTLTSGDEVHIFTGQPGVNFSETFNTSYIVTDKHLGHVRSSFQCGNQILNISCSGVTNLQRETPTCKITSDKDTSNLEIGDNITLSLTVNNTYCTENKTTSLTTGNETYRSPEQSDENITGIVVYQFTITVNHLGTVESTFRCGDKLYTLNCDGVRMLKQAVSDENHIDVTVAWIVPVAATVGVIVAAVIAAAIVVVVRRKRNQNKHKKKDLTPLPRGGTKLGDDDYTYASIDDNLTIGDTTTFNRHQGKKEPGKTSLVNMADKKFHSSSMNDYQDTTVVIGPGLHQNSHQGNKEPGKSPKADVTDVNPYAMTPLHGQADQNPIHRDKKSDISDNKERATKTNPETMYAVVNKKNK